MAQIGFIGMGNMGRALLLGALKAFPKEEFLFHAKTQGTMRRVYEETGVNYTDSNAECARRCKYLILAVKPQQYEAVLRELTPVLASEHIVISLAPSAKISRLKQSLGDDRRIVRAMPNTPAMVGEGMTAVSLIPDEYSVSEMENLKKIFQSCGRVEFIEETLMGAASCVGGCSPAFAYLFIEALADSAVRYGMPRKQAYVFAAQAVKGAAALALKSGEHPGALKDQVCSPAGLTIEGVAALEEHGLRNAVLKASEAVYKKISE